MVLSIGHSNRRTDEFVALLTAHGVTAIADVRAVPQSRRNPHFSRRNLQLLLADAGIVYEHFPALGGHRTARPDSPNGAWKNEAFRGYADHMRDEDFLVALDRLLDFAKKYLVAMMCAESQWRDCHRQIIADLLTVRFVEVRHIMSLTATEPHLLTPSAHVSGTTIEYPALF